MTIAQFDQISVPERKDMLFHCCGSSAWVKGMMEIFPVQNFVDLLEYAEEKWYDCNPADWLEAFENHARLGDRKTLNAEDDLYGKSEQEKLLAGDTLVIDALKKANEQYEDTFGYMFISFAHGKTAKQLLEELEQRLENDPRDELQIAASEQYKITKSRLEKLFF